MRRDLTEFFIGAVRLPAAPGRRRAPRRPHHRARVAGLVALSVLLAGCGARFSTHVRRPDGLEWPAGDPRLRLESVIDLGGGERRMPAAPGGAGEEWRSARFVRPYGVAWAGDDLLIADPGSGRVARVSPGGGAVFSREGLFLQPIGIAACDQGIVVTDSGAGRVALLREDLGFSRWLVRDLLRPSGVACDGGIYIAETGRHRILVLEQGGAEREIGGRGTEAGRFNFPAAVALDGGDLLVGDTLNFRVQRLDASDGSPLAAYGRLGDAPGETPRIKGVAVDRSGHLWVSDGHLDQVSLFERDGTLLIALGGTGAADGEFSFPAGISAHPDGRVVVMDSFNRRLQIFRVIESGGPGSGAGAEVDR